MWLLFSTTVLNSENENRKTVTGLVGTSLILDAFACNCGNM